MEAFKQTLEWWRTHKAALASVVLVLVSLLTIAFPVFAQRRLSKLSLGELTRQCPHLRWPGGGSAWCLGEARSAWCRALFYRYKQSPRLSDDQGAFLLAVILCIPSLSAGLLALCT